MGKIVGIGAAVFDILMTADRFPPEDTKLQGRETKLQCGGPCATALVAARKLGEEAAYLGTLGTDLYGSFIARELEKYGVDIGRVRRLDGTSFHSFVLLNLSNTSRTCVWNRGNVPEPEERELDLSLLRQASFLHLDGNHLDFAILAAKKARELGVPVSLDAGGTYPGIERLLQLVDILIPSEEFARKITGKENTQEAAQVLTERYAPKLLFITQGSRGGFRWAEGKAERYPVYPVEAVDSNGAGDTFHGAFLAGLCKGMAVMEAAAFASATSALKCTRFGAQQGIPGYAEVLEFQKSHPGVIRDA